MDVNERLKSIDTKLVAIDAKLASIDAKLAGSGSGIDAGNVSLEGLTEPDADGVTWFPQFQFGVKLDRPVNRAWIPQQRYRSANQNRIAVGDISNAPMDEWHPDDRSKPESQRRSVPKRSPSGHNLIYTSRKPDGTPDYDRPGVIQFGDHTFKDEAELAGWRKANKASEDQLRGYGHKPGVPPPPGTSPPPTTEVPIEQQSKGGATVVP